MLFKKKNKVKKAFVFIPNIQNFPTTSRERSRWIKSTKKNPNKYMIHKNASRINKSGKQNKNNATVNICASVSVLKMAAMRWQKMGTTVKN